MVFKRLFLVFTCALFLGLFSQDAYSQNRKLNDCPYKDRAAKGLQQRSERGGSGGILGDFNGIGRQDRDRMRIHRPDFMRNRQGGLFNSLRNTNKGRKGTQSYSKTILADKAEIEYNVDTDDTICIFEVSIFLPNLTDEDKLLEILDKTAQNLNKSFLPKHVNVFYTDTYLGTDMDDDGGYIDFGLERDNLLVYEKDKEFFNSCNEKDLQNDFERAIGNSLNY
jgi:hypothetical protein